MLFNANRPTSEAALARLFTGNPNMTPDEVGSNLFVNSSQGYGYVQNQAKQLGMGDPVEYFRQQQLAKTIATQQNGMQAELARQAGQYDPRSLPGQLASRDAAWNAVTNQQTQQAQQVAALQNQHRMAAFPLPAMGQSPNLSPVMQEDMRQQGIANPMEYLLAQRLGPNRGAVASLAGLQNSVDPEALYNESTFRNAALQKPQVAGGVFQALTGGDLGAYDKNYTASKAADQTRGTKYLFDSLKDRSARMGASGQVEWNQMVPDPTTGKMVPSNNYAAGDAFQKSQEKYLPHVDQQMAQFQALAARRGTPVAGLQMAPPEAVEGTVPAPFAASGQGGDYSTSLVGNTLAGMAGDVGRMFSGRGVNNSLRSASDFVPPQGRAPVHARALLANNPQFQALARKDPARARAIIMSIQQGGLDNSPLMQIDDNTQLYGP